LRLCDLVFADLDTHVGEVAGLDDIRLPPALTHYDCRNNRLAYLGLCQDDFEQAVARAREHYGANRIAVILGTSTSGILRTETAYRQRDPATGALPEWFSYRYTHNIFSSGDFVRHVLQLTGPAYVISTACSSSAKVFANAHRLLKLGVCDAAVVGGVDSLCATTLYGFSSLELVAREPCRPADVRRNGISIGEAAGFALLERADSVPTDDTVVLLGYGESSDAYHMSSPHPEGAGARLAMQQALISAGLEPGAIDYINLHGTASKVNDAVEDRAVSDLFGDKTPCSSTKGWTGHTLGASGITEAVIAALCIQHGFIPGSLNTTEVDPAFTSRIELQGREQPVARVLSNSFGFGGNNCSLIFGAVR
jgi:3-oxoacyl-[acyl-carrier-protein] synthase-1